MSLALDTPLLSRLRRALGGPARALPDWRRQDEMALKAELIVRVFYAVTLAIFYRNWQMVQGAGEAWATRDPLWPSRWLDLIPAGPATNILILVAFTAGFAAFAAPRVRAFRVLVTLSALQVGALENSGGYINHSLHEWIWLAVVLCFLPNGNPGPDNARAHRQQTILMVASATTLLLLFYTMSGAYKVWFALEALVRGEMGGFSPHAMASTVAWRTIETRTVPPLAPLILEWPLLGWPLYLFVYFVELTAIAVAFRPRLLRLWGYGLILFHLGTAAFMGIVFWQHVVWNALFMVMAPQARDIGDWRTALGELPMLGWLVRRFSRRAVPARANPTPAE